MFESRISAGRTEKLSYSEKSESLFIVLWHGRSCQEMWQTILWVGTQDDSSTLQSFYSMRWWSSSQRRRTEILGTIVKSMHSNCFAILKLDTYWTTPIFYSQWTNLHDRSENVSKRVTNDYLVWSVTLISRVNTNSIDMLETLQNNADWDCFKTPILQKILRIQNLHQEEHYAFSEVIHLFHSVGCVRNKLQFRTVQQNQKSVPWMHD